MYLVEEENKLLAWYDVNNLKAAISAIYNELFVMAFHMQGYTTHEKVDSLTLSIMGELLLQSLRMLSKTGSILVDYSLVEVQHLLDS